MQVIHIRNRSVRYYQAFLPQAFLDICHFATQLHCIRAFKTVCTIARHLASGAFLSQFTEKGFKKTENIERNGVGVSAVFIRSRHLTSAVI